MKKTEKKITTSPRSQQTPSKVEAGITTAAKVHAGESVADPFHGLVGPEKTAVMDTIPLRDSKVKIPEQFRFPLTARDWRVPRTVSEETLWLMTNGPFKIPLAEVALNSLWRTALHEAGHVIVAEELKLKPEAKLWIDPAPSPSDNAVKGRMSYRDYGNRLGDACIAYGGLIASFIELPGGELETDLGELAESINDAMSETDRLSIEGYPDEWEPLQIAREILYLRRREVVAYARELVAEFWANEAA